MVYGLQKCIPYCPRCGKEAFVTASDFMLPREGSNKFKKFIKIFSEEQRIRREYSKFRYMLVNNYPKKIKEDNPYEFLPKCEYANFKKVYRDHPIIYEFQKNPMNVKWFHDHQVDTIYNKEYHEKAKSGYYNENDHDI